ncbi:MAG: hypothetical protein K2X47_11435, partial [Bdellovibrionales bacterium]|nr:hypothetical protein [Bdellovibrionales bacterium]
PETKREVAVGLAEHLGTDRPVLADERPEEREARRIVRVTLWRRNDHRDDQVNEYGEGGSGLKPPPKKETVGEKLSTIEEKKSAATPKAAPTPADVTPAPEEVDDAEEQTVESEESGEPAPTDETADSEDTMDSSEIKESAGVDPDSKPEIPAVTEAPSEAQADLEADPDPVAETKVSETPTVSEGTSSYVSNPAHGSEHHECTCSKRTQFEPYKDRRQRWATLFNIGTSFFNPTEYEPEYAVGAFNNLYGQGIGETIDISMGAKLNLGNAGALAFLIGGGQYKKTASNGSSLSLTPVTAGAVYYLDTLFKEPYVVPYVGGGGYTLFYREALASSAVGGRTGFGFYYVAGLAFQLDWMDEYGDLHQFSESEIENTFIYVEARGTSEVLTPESIKQKNFSNMFHAAAGLRFEF